VDNLPPKTNANVEKIKAMRQKQPLSELQRKAKKAHRHRGKIWTVEEIEAARAEAEELWPLWSKISG